MTNEPVWVVAYEIGTKENPDGAGFAWLPDEDRDTAVAMYNDMLSVFPANDEGRSLVTVYFVEYHPTTPYSLDPKVREKITEEIERELWEFLPDDRPDA